VIGIAAVAAALGTLNGWILMAGRIPLSAAADGVFFHGLAAVHTRFGTPARALVVGTAVSSGMLLLYFSKSLLGVFNFIVLLSVLLTLLPHLFTTAAEFKLGRRIVAAIAFVFILYAIYGVGYSVILWGLLLVAAGVPLYFVLRRPGNRVSAA
jgi:APA family basic amino acid/polyamine antiporter